MTARYLWNFDRGRGKKKKKRVQSFRNNHWGNDQTWNGNNLQQKYITKGKKDAFFSHTTKHLLEYQKEGDRIDCTWSQYTTPLC